MNFLNQLKSRFQSNIISPLQSAWNWQKQAGQKFPNLGRQQTALQQAINQTQRPIYPTPTGQPISQNRTTTQQRTQQFGGQTRNYGGQTNIGSSFGPTNNATLLATLSALQEQAKGIQGGLTALQNQPAQNQPTDNLAALQAEVQKQLVLSPEEEEAQRQLNQIISSRELGLQAVREKPIAMEFITGQRAALESRAATQAVPVTQQLALLQGKRQAALDVVKTKLEAEKERVKQAQPIEVGGNLVKFNPVTNKYEAVYSGAQKASGDVAEFQQIYNKMPTLEEYTQFLRAKSNASAKPISEAALALQALRDITLREKGAVPGQIVYAASNTPVKLTDAQSQFFSMGAHLADTATEVKQIINQIGTNALKGWVTEKGYLVPVVQNALDPQQQALMQKMYDMNNLFVYFSTGKQINETEFNRLAKQTPNFKATPTYNESALNQFSKMINDRMGNYMKINGWTIYGGEEQQQSSGDFQAELDDDIQGLANQMSREEIIRLAQQNYPELTLDQIASRVYTLIPDRR